MTSLKGLRLAVYARFSSDNQRDRSIDDQVRLCQEHLTRHDGQLRDDRILTDYAISGTSNARAGFDQVLKLIETKEIDVLVTESQDRLSRDLGDSDRLWKLARFNDVRLICVSDGIDSAFDGSRLQFSVKALMSDEYLADLGKKTRRGLDGAARRGLSTGGLPYGYKSKPILNGGREPEGYEIEIHPEQSQTILRIFNLYRDGHSLLSIAEHLNKEGIAPPRSKAKSKFWRKPTLREILRNRAYLGEWSFGVKKWHKDPITRKRRYKLRAAADVFTDTRPHLQIVSHDLWEAVRSRIEVVTAKYKKGQGGAAARRCARPFSGLLQCGVCGRPMVHSGGTRSVYYKCSGAHSGRVCDNRQAIREDILVDHAVGELKRVLTEASWYEKLRSEIEARLREFRVETDAERTQLERELPRAEAEVEKLLDYIKSTTLSGPTIQAVTASLDKAVLAKQQVEAKLAALASKPAAEARLPTLEEIASLALDVEARLRDDPIGGREMLRQLLHGEPLKMNPLADGGWKADSMIFPIELPKCTKPRELALPGLRTGCEKPIVARGRNYTWTTGFMVPIEVRVA